MARSLAVTDDLLQDPAVGEFEFQQSRTHQDTRQGQRQDSRSGPGSDAFSAGVGVRPGGMKFRDFGLHASRTQDSISKHTPVRSILPNTNNSNSCSYYYDQDIHGYEADEDDDFENTSPNPIWSPSVAYSTPQTSVASYSHSGSIVEDPSSPCVPLSPRWDSLGYDRAAVLSPTSPTLSNHHSRSSNTTDELYLGGNSLTFGARDEFPSFPTKKLNSTEPVRVDNFSRKRKPSIKQPYNDPNQFRPINQATGEPAHFEHSNHPLSWPRERGPSTSSDMSAATFASAPIQPPDMRNRDNVRSRGRQANYPAYRPPVSYRAESSGPTYAREPLPRMASVPNDELRSSYRSQLSASTGQGTAATERSSVLTKSSSITSVYGAVDDNFSIDDVMGMYEKGFYDDSAAEENDSRPPTAISEERRRRATVLDAMNDLMSKPSQPLTVPAAGPVVRDSASIFRDPNIRDSLPAEIPEESPEEAPQNIESGDADLNNQNNIEAEDESDEEEDNKFPAPSRQATNLTAAEDISDRDRYGFRKSNQYVSQEQYDGWDQGYTEYLARRRRKWMAYLREHGLMTDNPNRFPPRSNKTKRFVRKGIPPDWRGAAWFYYAGGPAVLAKHPGMYDTLLKQKAKEVDSEAIERDLHRTFPDNVRFRSSESPTASNEGNQQGEGTNVSEKRMISSLRRVLHAFSIYNPRIGYCQSLNFLAGLLLLFVETEEHAFWLLNIITRVYLPGTHEMSLEGANVDLGVLMSSLREAMPQVWAKIGGELDGTEADAAWPLRWKNRHAPEPTQLPPITLCMTAWFMSCFIGTLPIETTLRVWDVFFYEGSKTLFRIALAIFKIGESEIRAVGDPMEIFQVVQTIPRRLVDSNGLMEACFRRRNGFGHLSQETVEQKRQERRNLVKAEREKLTRKNEAGGPNMDTKKKGAALFGRR